MMMYRTSGLLLVIIVSLCLPRFGISQVIVSIPPQKQFVDQIAANRLSVEVILTPGESPETYSPSPRQLSKLSNASLYIQMGVPFERHWSESLEKLNPDMKIVKCCQQFSGILKNVRQEDMHYWTDPVFVQHYLALITDTLIELQPENKEIFKSNFIDYTNSIKQLDRIIIEKLKHRRIDQFIISHSALDAYSDRYGLLQLSLEQSGRESGPRKLLSIVETAKRQDIKTLFIIEQYHTRAVNNLAVQLGADIVMIDPMAEDYIANMLVITEKLTKALGGEQ